MQQEKEKLKEKSKETIEFIFNFSFSFSLTSLIAKVLAKGCRVMIMCDFRNVVVFAAMRINLKCCIFENGSSYQHCTKTAVLLMVENEVPFVVVVIIE